MYYKTRQLEIKAEYCGGNFSSSPGELRRGSPWGQVRISGEERMLPEILKN